MKFNTTQANQKIKDNSLTSLTGQVAPDVWFDRKLKANPCPSEGGGVNSWHCEMVRYARGAGLTLDETVSFIRPHSNRKSDFKGEITRIYNTSPVEIGSFVSWKQGDAAASKRKAKPLIFRTKTKITLTQSQLHKPETLYHRNQDGELPRDEQAILMLEAIDRTLGTRQDLVCWLSLKSKYKEPEPTTRLLADWMIDPSFITNGSEEGIWLVPNFSKGMKKENITHRHLLVCECDDPSLTIKEQVKRLLSSNLPFITITHSAGKSAHGLCHIGDCQSDDEFKARGRQVYHTLEALGIPMDWKCLHANRVSRMAGGVRAGKEQTLLWAGQCGWIDW